MVNSTGHIPLGDLLRAPTTKPVASFPIVRTNNYGRMMISAQMNTHDRLIRNAEARTDHRISPGLLAQMEYNRKMEKWKPGYNELQKKTTDDNLLAELIATATHRCDERLDKHVIRFKKNRAKNPRYKPGWLEAYCNGKTMAVHEELLASAKPRIDAAAPEKAMQFRNFLRSCEYTRGGFPRVDTSKTKKIKLPPVDDPVPGVPRTSKTERAALQEELENKYAMMLFKSQMLGATSDDVRLLYAKSNRLEVQDQYEAALDKCATLPLSSAGTTMNSPSALGTATVVSTQPPVSPELSQTCHARVESEAEVSMHQL